MQTANVCTEEETGERQGNCPNYEACGTSSGGGGGDSCSGDGCYGGGGDGGIGKFPDTIVPVDDYGDYDD